jgi:isocitrate dehydrogenase
VFTPNDGSAPTKHLVHTFDGPGCYMGMFNTEESIKSFARSCFVYALGRGYPLRFSSKNTILKKYDGLFKDTFEKIYKTEFADKYK